MTNNEAWRTPNLTELDTVVEATGQNDKIGSAPDDAAESSPDLDGTIQPDQ